MCCASQRCAVAPAHGRRTFALVSWESKSRGSSRTRGRIAQLVRAPALQAGSRGFESLSAHHFGSSALCSRDAELSSTDLRPNAGAHLFLLWPESTAARGALWLLLLICALPAFPYSLLTHEQLIDLTWDDSIVPLLLSRYPNLTKAQLEEARAYAYGGCVIQDIGYYPFGQMSFSDLTHYVRSGDFVVYLFRDARNANELAFAVGALSHYIGDSYGHALATNLAVPVEFHKLERKYGHSVNYAEGEHQHVQTEFAFDIDEIAHHRMAPVRYLRHIGLRVPTRQLSLAFYQTYGLSNKFTGHRRQWVNVGAYRFAVRAFIPRIAYALTLIHRHHEPPDSDTPEAQALHAEVAAMARENDWDKYRRHAGIGTWTLAGLIVILPKVGPLKLVDVKGPTQSTEADYVHSVVVSVAEFRRALRRFTPIVARGAGSPPGCAARFLTAFFP